MTQRPYRGKRIDSGEWAHGCYAYYKLPFTDTVEHFIILEGLMPLQVDPATVGQYTGLKDKDGRKVFDGDVVKVPDLYETPENTATTFHNELVDFEGCCFRLDGRPLYEDAEYVSDECEVIGNRWDHPHLLKG